MNRKLSSNLQSAPPVARLQWGGLMNRVLLMEKIHPSQRDEPPENRAIQFCPLFLARLAFKEFAQEFVWEPSAGGDGIEAFAEPDDLVFLFEDAGGEFVLDHHGRD